MVVETAFVPHLPNAPKSLPDAQGFLWSKYWQLQNVARCCIWDTPYSPRSSDQFDRGPGTCETGPGELIASDLKAEPFFQLIAVCKLFFTSRTTISLWG
jgi:hypothetical protein